MSKWGNVDKYFMFQQLHTQVELPTAVPLTLLPVPLPTGGCASAACLIVHTISSMRALSCRSDIATGGRKQATSALMHVQDTLKMTNLWNTGNREQRRQCHCAPFIKSRLSGFSLNYHSHHLKTDGAELKEVQRNVVWKNNELRAIQWRAKECHGRQRPTDCSLSLLQKILSLS